MLNVHYTLKNIYVIMYKHIYIMELCAYYYITEKSRHKKENQYREEYDI